jgi:hypothetical protein
MGWTGHAEHTVAIRNAYKIVVAKLEGKRALGRPRRRWVDIIMGLTESG